MLLLTASCLAVSTGCASQLALDFALKRNVSKDAAKYEKAINDFTMRYPEWMKGLKDTTMISPNDGARLHAIYMSAPQPTSKTAFILHGHTENAARFLGLAKWYNEKLGCNIFMPDFYAHGLSEGRYRHMGWLDRFDFIEWMKMANSIFSPEGGQTQMIVTGVSMGGAATMMVSADIQEQGLDFVKCLVEDCGYTSFYAQAEYLAPNIPVAPKDELKRKALLDKIDSACKRKYGWSFSEASSLTQVSKCHLPMLFIHGGADKYVPTSMVYEAYEAKPGEKEILIVPDAGHARAMRTDLYREVVEEFVSKYIKPETFTNPILHSDYSDPDLICVDGEYWMTSSSFSCVPGLQILHSTDLLNWEIVNAGLPDALKIGWKYRHPSHGCGVWAPSIRYFNGQYWIFWGDPDFGVFQIHAPHPAGQWSDPVRIWAGQGMIDTCPLVDDDGRIYMVHAWAGSRAGFKSVLGVCELDQECTRVIGKQVLVFDGKHSGDDTIEGPKFYKRNGWYYIFAPSGGVKRGWQVVLRSRNVYGPYEYRRVLHQGGSDVYGPHQGGWVEDAAGNCWFMHFEDRYAYGRVVHLQPMKWLDDDWCTIGEDIDGDGIGEPVKEYRKPAPFPAKASDAAYPRAVSALSTATDFKYPYLPYNWQWHANPSDNWALLCPSLGYIRLNCIQNSNRWKNLWDTPNLLLEKVVGPSMELSAKLVFRPSYEGDRAGLVMMGMDYSTLEMVYENGEVLLRRVNCLNAEDGNPETVEADTVVIPVDAEATPKEGVRRNDNFYSVWVKLSVSQDNAESGDGGKDGVPYVAKARFSYSLDGSTFKALGSDFTLREGKWIGAKTGFFATATTLKNDGGSVDVY